MVHSRKSLLVLLGCLYLVLTRYNEPVLGSFHLKHVIPAVNHPPVLRAIGRRILLYNSICTFRLLVQAGDIHPNPGPSVQPSHEVPYQPSPRPYQSIVSPSSHQLYQDESLITYDRATLLNLQNSSIRVEPSVWTTIRSL